MHISAANLRARAFINSCMHTSYIQGLYLKFELKHVKKIFMCTRYRVISFILKLHCLHFQSLTGCTFPSNAVHWFVAPISCSANLPLLRCSNPWYVVPGSNALRADIWYPWLRFVLCVINCNQRFFFCFAWRIGGAWFVQLFSCASLRSHYVGLKKTV